MILSAQGRPAASQRIYHPITIAGMASENPVNWKNMRTHIQVQGFVTYLKREADGDIHIRVCDAVGIKGMDHSHCIVAECIPKLPCEGPRIGEQIIIRGISRYDSESPGHHWWEVHPVEELRVLK